jgi:hypothetical protein
MWRMIATGKMDAEVERVEQTGAFAEADVAGVEPATA